MVMFTYCIYYNIIRYFPPGLSANLNKIFDIRHLPRVKTDARSDKTWLESPWGYPSPEKEMKKIRQFL
jgi:hypothetical protein